MKNPETTTLFQSVITNSLFISYSKKQKSKSLFFTPVIFIFLLNIQLVSSQRWDGVLITQSEMLALQAFKQELKDPKGYLKTWNQTGYGACTGSWIGIKCAQGQVIAIQLPWKGLGGKLTEKIGQLQGLRKLSLHDNYITGSIPKSLGFLPNLRGVYLFNNKLSGSIPPSLGSLSPSVRIIDFSNNSLSGSIPHSFINSTKLVKLNFSFNSLSGNVPGSLFNSSSLVLLDLEHNNLSGSIPSYPFVGSKIQYLNLGHNFISGSIPVGFSNLSSLVSLNLENNKLGNKIPSDLAKMHNLSVLNLKGNQFSGEIPEAIGNVSTLTELDLSQNKLSGEIPQSFVNLQKIVSFNVSYNNLAGHVPLYLSKKFNSSSFVGNLQLCGYRGGTPCPSQAPSQIVPSSLPEEPIGKHHHRLSTKDIILIAAGVLLILLLIICLILICCLLRKRAALKGTSGRATARDAATRREKGLPPGAGEVETGGDNGGKLVHFDGPVVFTTDDLLCATAEIMGKSTYGTVYKATLEDGNQVAVKRLREKITKSQKEFESEADLLGRIRHPNLLPLRAYYLGPKGEKLLVFDYMPKGSLAAFLHARGPETAIDWPMRMRIAQGVTRGLVYLHNHVNIIHGNLTSSNVLLDEETNAKIADYGLSRLMIPAAGTNAIALAGSVGYRAPELSKLKKPNTKIDVYSLGVLILELLTGKSPSEETNGIDLPHWVASIVKEEWTNEVFDVELMKDTSTIGDELLNTLKLALHCVDPSPSARPEVQEVLQQLEEIRPDATTTTAAAASSKPPEDEDGDKGIHSESAK